MITIDNKFEIGQEVFMIEKETFKEKCLNCKGQGFVTNENKIDLKCPYCKGEGKVYLKDNKWIVSNRNLKIKNIKTNFNENLSLKVKYVIGGYSKMEEDLFASREEAQEKCNELNKIN